MKQVEISTSNHVSIAYELSSVWQRLFAFIIDLIVIFMWLLIAEKLSDGFNAGALNETAAMILSFIFSLPAIFYSLLCEVFFKGQSIGKALLGLKVSKMDGTNPGFGEATIRWSFRLVDIWFSAGSMAMLLVAGSENSQRVGDTLANTIVMNKKSKDLYSIDDILSLKDTSEYKSDFPGIIRFTDDDMLLIKNALDRAEKYPNKNNEGLLQELRNRVTSDLGLDELKASNKKFLKKALQDYIVLTRS